MKSKTFLVRTTKDLDGIPEGSGVHVASTTKTLYKGTWSSMFGSYEVSVPKKHARRARE